MRKFVFASGLLLMLTLTVYANSVQSDLSENLLRLHIIANSNSEKDQEIKLKVRDAIIKEIGNEFECISDKTAYREKLIQNCERIKKIADSALSDTPYKCNVSFEKLYIPRKIYNGIILPEGSYEGLVVRLGRAEGENWWCVVYPPLCFTESTYGKLSDEGMAYLKDRLSPAGYSMISEDGTAIEYKFKIVEFFQKLKCVDFQEIL